MKDDPPPPSSSTKRLSELELLAMSASSLGFSWKVPDLPEFNDQYLVSRYFPLRDFHFRFHLFSTGKASENTFRECWNLYLEIDGVTRGATGSVCCKVTVLNLEGVAQSEDKYVFRRYSTHGMKSNGQNEFYLFGSLQGFDSEFLLNGTDLYFHGSILILDDDWSFVKVPLPQQSQRNVDDDPTDTIEGVYEGKFTWTLKNYNCLRKKFEHNGMLASPPFPIAEALYQILLETKKESSSLPVNRNYFSMFLRGGLVNGEDKRLWCFLQVEMRDKKICTTCGRLGLDLGRIDLLDTKTFEFAYNDPVEIIVRFSAMKEKFYLTKELKDSKNVPIYDTKTSNESNSIENKKVTKKEFLYCHWEILNFSRLVDQLNRSINMGAEFCFRSRRISIGETGAHLIIYPRGRTGDRDRVWLYLERLKSSKPRTRVEKDERTPLLYFALSMHGLTRPTMSSKHPPTVEHITRSDEEIAAFRHRDYVVRPEIFSKRSGGDVYDEPFVVTAHIRVLEETLEMVGMKIRWEVENFISPVATQTGRIDSNYIKISEGLRLCICIGVANGDGILYGGLRSDRSLLVKFGLVYDMSIQLAVLNQKNLNETQWKEHSFLVHKHPVFNLGKLSDLLKEDAGYIVEDKFVVACNIIKCDCPQLQEPRAQEEEEDRMSSTED